MYIGFQELNTCLNYIAEEDQIPLQKRLEFFIETRHAVGKTGLILSGGGKLGLYHIGVLKVLWENDLLPKVITGSSSGSIMASYICSKRDEELADVNNKNIKGVRYHLN